MGQLNDVIKTALDNLQQVIDANTIIGNPINTASGTTIIPISKITLGIASGGVDFKSKKEDEKTNFGGGNGVGVSVSPVAFIVVDANGDAKIMSMDNAAAKEPDTIQSINSIVAKLPECFAKAKKFFSKNKDSEKNNKETETNTDIAE